MKKALLILPIVFGLLLSSCTTIPGSKDAKQKLEELGYTVELFTQTGDAVADQNISQVTVLRATKDHEYIDVYFFANEKDTDTFYSNRSKSISANAEVVKKNQYSIYRGTKQGVKDFLS